MTELMRAWRIRQIATVPLWKFYMKTLPMILQSETTECGLACLSMIFNFYRSKVDLIALRDKYPASLKGVTLASLMKIAKRFCFEVQAFDLKLHQLSTLTLPCLLHWNSNHFVVLAKIKKSKAIIYDPALGKKAFSFHVLSKHFMGIALELKPNQHYQPLTLTKKLTLKQLLNKTVRLKKHLVYIVIFALLLQMIVIISPQYVQKSIEAVKIGKPQNYFLCLALAFIALKALEMGVSILRSLGIVRLGALINFHIGKNMMTHLFQLPLDYFEKRHTGDMIARLVSIDKIRQVVSQGMVEGFVDGSMSVATLIVMFYYQLSMAMVVIIFAWIYFIVSQVMYHKIKAATDSMIQFNAAQSTHLIETIKGIHPIKLFSKENFRARTWLSQYTNFIRATIAFNWLTILFVNSKMLLFGIELILIVLLGALAVSKSLLSIGALYAFLFYLSQFNTAIGSFIDKLLDYKLLTLHLNRLADVVLQEAETRKSSALKLSSPITSIQVKQLCFRYSDLDRACLNNINFTIRPGEWVAIIGPSGFGKTTLLKLLMGLFQPTSGTVLINGVNLQVLNKSDYRCRLASVMQNDQLFSGSLLDNITFFARTSDQEKMIHCAELSGIHATIMKMPMQYQTLISETGTVLSGGERQRILLARALYRAPEVLFLDEASSHLDLKKEKQIFQSLKQLEMIKIIVTHRPETLAIADRVIDLTGFSGEEACILKNRIAIHSGSCDD